MPVVQIPDKIAALLLGQRSKLIALFNRVLLSTSSFRIEANINVNAELGVIHRIGSLAVGTSLAVLLGDVTSTQVAQTTSNSRRNSDHANGSERFGLDVLEAGLSFSLSRLGKLARRVFLNVTNNDVRKILDLFLGRVAFFFLAVWKFAERTLNGFTLGVFERLSTVRIECNTDDRDGHGLLLFACTNLHPMALHRQNWSWHEAQRYELTLRVS